MNISSQIAKQFRDVHFGENWTAVNLKETLSDVTWKEAITKVHSFNTIALLVYHIHYYVSVVTKVLNNEPLNASDKYSFDLPPIQSQEDWDNLLDETWRDAKTFAELIEQFPVDKLQQDFPGKEYGTYYRNLAGIIEHTHYHLGQIVLIKKIIREGN